MDTTAKVDIRKLQLLNDRIAQTIDALNQVRLSVHGLGLSHTSAGIPAVGMGVPFQASPYAATPYAAYAYPGIASYAQQAFAGWPASVHGLSHTSPWNYASYPTYAGYPQSASFAAQQVSPLLSQLLWQQGVSGGLSHTGDVWGASPMAYHPGVNIDPITATRIMQMFPFAQMPVSPVQ
jgi:hypothetical protein